MRRLVSRSRLSCPHALEVLKGDQPMKKISKQAQRMEVSNDKPLLTMGLDLGDRFSHYCMLNEAAEVAEERPMQSTEVTLKRHLTGEPPMPVPLESRTHPPPPTPFLTH